MNIAAKRRTGQPLVVFSILLLGWGGMRVVVWESPFPEVASILLAAATPDLLPTPILTALLNGTALPRSGTAAAPAARLKIKVAGLKPMGTGGSPVGLMPSTSISSSPPELLVSHQLHWLGAMGRMPVSPEISRMIRQTAAARPASPPGPALNQPLSATRWSLDSWLFLRPDAAVSAITGPAFATYGASQAGAVLRYQLRPGSPFRPAVYLRASRALAAGRQSEIAAGVSVIPARAIPIAVHAELRGTRDEFSTELRPAAFAVTQLPPVTLPLRLRGESYLAAGYVAGKFATAFVDGQARVERKILQFNGGSVRAGAGAWGGAQKGASRLDIGPSVSVNLQLGSVPARLAVDYRLRAAGSAVPRSGVAMTLSTGF